MARERGGRPCLAVILLVCFLASAHALVILVEYRLPLGVLLGGSFWWILLGLLAGLTSLAVAARDSLRSSRPRGLGPYRLLFCILVAGAAVYLILLQPFRRLYFDLTLGLCTGLFGLLLVAGERLVPSPAPRFARVLDWLLFNLCFLLVFCEVGLRVAASIRPSPLFAQADVAVLDRIDQMRYRPGRVRFGFPCNSGGHYDTEFHPRESDEPLAIMIGDSFSAGIVPHYYHFTTVCERLLGRGAVYNMGVPSIGPYEYLYLLQYEALPLDPSVVVIDIFIGNDLQDARERQPRAYRGLRLWFDRDNLLLLKVPERLAILAGERRGLQSQTVGVPLGETTADSRIITDEQELAREYPWVLDYTLEQPAFSANSHLGQQVARATWTCQPGITDFAPTFRALAEMRRIAGRVPLLVVIIPCQFQVDDPLWQQVQTRVAPLTLDRDSPQRILEAWLVQQGIEYLDLLPELRKVTPDPDGGRHCYHRNDTHFNARGNRVAGQAITRFLAPYFE